MTARDFRSWQRVRSWLETAGEGDAGTWLLWTLLILGIARLWLMPLPSSFWVDEMGSAFVVHFGARHWSFAVAPQVPESVYYRLPKALERLFGFSETVYRIPSILAMGAAVFLVSRLASRLVHPQAAWFAVFACLSLRGINYEACNARPYALGACVFALSLWCLVRWLDTGQVAFAAGFTAFAALLWRVHLIFWPLYLVFAIYAIVRLKRRETPVRWAHAILAFGVLGLALIPVALNAISLLRHAQAHSFAALPNLRELIRALKLYYVGGCATGAWLLRKYVLRKDAGKGRTAFSAAALILGFWLVQPVCLFAFSWLTSDSVFIDRYLSVALPGVALALVAAVACFLPPSYWRPITILYAIAVLATMMNWREPWPLHHNSNWRGAAEGINRLRLNSATPVICPSPFIEAQTPVWTPDYPLPAFIYSYLPVYPIAGRLYLFPFKDSREAENYALYLSHNQLRTASRFLIYGGDRNVRLWRKYFAMRPEFQTWVTSSLGRFGDVQAVVFEPHVNVWKKF